MTLKLLTVRRFKRNVLILSHKPDGWSFLSLH